MSNSVQQISKGSIYTIPSRPSDGRIAELERMPYDKYLDTHEWAALRDWALWADGYRCRLCNYDKGLQVHHRYYCKRGTETMDTLTTLCGPCHANFHKHIGLYSPKKIRLKPVLNETPLSPRSRPKPHHEKTRRGKRLSKHSKWCFRCEEIGSIRIATKYVKGGRPVCNECWDKLNNIKPAPLPFTPTPISAEIPKELDKVFAEIVARNGVPIDEDDPINMRVDTKHYKPMQSGKYI